MFEVSWPPLSTPFLPIGNDIRAGSFERDGAIGFKVTTSCVTVIEIYFLELDDFRVASDEKENFLKKETSFYHLAGIQGYLLGVGEGVFCQLPSCRAGGRV